MRGRHRSEPDRSERGRSASYGAGRHIQMQSDTARRLVKPAGRGRFFATAAVAMVLACGGGGCAGTAPVIGEPSSATQPVQPTPSAGTYDPGAPSAAATLQGVLLPQDLVVGTPIEVYTRVARGVLTCWFGADGPLKARFIYHAEAEPASKGGRSEIKIMTRDREAEDPRALRAYRIVIQPSDGRTRVEVENVRLPEPLAAQLKTDVTRWSRDEPGCGEGAVTAGWSAEEATPAAGGQNSAAGTRKP